IEFCSPSYKDRGHLIFSDAPKGPKVTWLFSREANRFPKFNLACSVQILGQLVMQSFPSMSSP
ncbi:hypothetical protein NPIL_541461, partial [Nephila pilipes]